MLSQLGISSRCDVVTVRHSFRKSNNDRGFSLTSLFYSKKIIPGSLIHVPELCPAAHQVFLNHFSFHPYFLELEVRVATQGNFLSYVA
jgi:hypothetical protein